MINLPFTIKHLNIKKVTFKLLLSKFTLKSCITLNFTNYNLTIHYFTDLRPMTYNEHITNYIGCNPCLFDHANFEVNMNNQFG